jgi:hypothetical protein
MKVFELTVRVTVVAMNDAPGVEVHISNNVHTGGQALVEKIACHPGYVAGLFAAKVDSFDLVPVAAPSADRAAAPAPVATLTDEELADCGLLSELDDGEAAPVGQPAAQAVEVRKEADHG